jgi:hypothetical protein
MKPLASKVSAIRCCPKIFATQPFRDINQIAHMCESAIFRTSTSGPNPPSIETERRREHVGLRSESRISFSFVHQTGVPYGSAG